MIAPIPQAPAGLVSLFEPWASLYSDSKLIATLVLFGHIAALLFAGGFAVALDRATLRAAASPERRKQHLEDLAGSHRIIVSGLVVSATTGLLLFTADIESYFGSWVFWTKMGLIVFMLLNGYGIMRAEKFLKNGGNEAEGWSQLKRTAIASLVFWFAIAFMGVALVNAA